jgi:hypothetical protein
MGPLIVLLSFGSSSEIHVIFCIAVHPNHKMVSDTSFGQFTDGLKIAFKTENQTKCLQFIKPHRNKTKKKRK